MIIGIKKCTSLLLVIVLFFSMGSMAFATDEDTQPQNVIMGTQDVQWVNTNSVYVDLSFEGSEGICGARVVGKSGTTRITGKVVLARKNSNGTYTTVKTWNNLKSADSSLVFEETYFVSSGYTYRLTITTTVYRNGTSEKVTKYAEDYAS